MNNYGTIIIGAGIAGLYTGYRLEKLGINYIILEQQNHIGGRMIQTEFHGSIVQLGAGTVRASDVNNLALINELGLKYTDYSSDYIYNIPHYSKSWFNKTVEELPYDYNVSVNNVLRNSLTPQEISLFKKCCNYGDFYRADALITQKYYPLDDLKHGSKDYHSIVGGYCMLPKKLASIVNDNIQLNTTVKRIVKEGDTYFIYTNQGNYSCSRLILAVELRGILKIHFDPLPSIVSTVREFVRPNKFLRMYTYHDNVSFTTPILANDSFKQIIPISKNVLLAAYCDNTDALEALDKITLFTNEQLTDHINKIIHPHGKVSPVKDRLIKFWNNGTHYYKPGYLMEKNYLEENNLFIVGEMVAWEQGWCQGSIHSVDNMFKEKII
jgi:hypothetical protein